MNRKSIPMFLFTIIALLSSTVSCGKNAKQETTGITNDKNLPVFEKIILKAKDNDWKNLAIGQRMGKIGLEMLGIQYIGGTLEVEPEKCVIDMTGLDCVTFFENVLDIARIIGKEKYGYEDLIKEVTFTRYRGGEITDYTSRLHYTADWIYDNIKKGVVKDITKELGGEIFNLNLDFMSTHTQLYKALKDNRAFVEVTREIEKKISGREYYYIPKDKIESIEDKLQTGDIVAFATNTKGLDYSHIGLVYVDEQGKRRLLHASSIKKKVVLDKTIHEYIKPIKKDIGITIVRSTD
ncbi:N-acetylmuramoyl-L-alanine amidase-like domain-containing protein [Bacteroidota bacterium]